jgi:hypothetical protein
MISRMECKSSRLSSNNAIRDRRYFDGIRNWFSSRKAIFNRILSCNHIGAQPGSTY